MTTFQEKFGGLRWRTRAARRLFRPGAQPHETFLPAIRQPDPTDGALDYPGAGFIFEGDVMSFGGWVAFDSGSPVTRVEGWLDGTMIGHARVSVPRPDVEALKDIPLARLSGFEMALGIHQLPPAVNRGARELRVVAVSALGERFEFGTVPIMLRPRPWITAPPPAPPEPATRPSEVKGLRVLVFTHQLTLGGAQLYLLDLLRQLQAAHQVELTVVSSTDGPLRRDLEVLGIEAHVTSMAPFEKLDSHLGRIGEVNSWLADGDFDVAFINTATSGASYGAEIAYHLDIPAVWAIHESFPPSMLWADLRPKVREIAEGTLAQASVAIFEADATRRIFEPMLGSKRSLTIPYGVDSEPIEKARRSLDLTSSRKKKGIPVDADLIVCVGTVEPRKAQVPLTQAFSMVAERHPKARLVFVGAKKDDPLTKDLEDVISESAVGDRVHLIPITPRVEDWYAIADFLVCASDVESLPRTVLEAMLWETPVLATDVFGLPELIEDGVNGWLCEARDLGALASGLERILNVPPEDRRRIAAAARELVEERHSLPRYAERIYEVLENAVKSAKASREREDDPDEHHRRDQH